MAAHPKFFNEIWRKSRRSKMYTALGVLIIVCSVYLLLPSITPVDAKVVSMDQPFSVRSDREHERKLEAFYDAVDNVEETEVKKMSGAKSHAKVTDNEAAINKAEKEEANSDVQLDLEQRVADLEAKSRFPPVKFLNYRERKRILVTGGAGFVGSHLVDRLMMMGHEVIVLDNFFTGRKRNVLRWMGHPNFELRNHDVTEEFRVEVDQIYHLASPASPPHYMENPIKTLKTNTVGTINMLGLAKRNHARFLLASTSEVYGDPEVHPQKETYWGHVNPIGPRACYDEGKRAAEALTYAYARYENVDVRVARIFNTFGPRMHMNDGRVVSNFILAALRKEPIRIYGDGKITRSFQYVSDLVAGLISLMNGNYTQPVNLGNPEEYTIAEFAKIIKELTGSSVPITNVEAAPDDPQRRKPDITLAQREIDWQPVVPMRDGLNRTIRYFRTELELSRQAEGMKIPLDLG